MPGLPCLPSTGAVHLRSARVDLIRGHLDSMSGTRLS
jgi:hypothetical protein